MTPTTNPGLWPPLMRAATAAAYVDEVNVEAFRRGVGELYPRPINVRGKGDRWLKDDLDAAIDKLASRRRQNTKRTLDAASIF